MLYSLYEDYQRNLEILKTEIKLQNKDTYPNYLSLLKTSNQVSYVFNKMQTPNQNEAEKITNSKTLGSKRFSQITEFQNS